MAIAAAAQGAAPALPAPRPVLSARGISIVCGLLGLTAFVVTTGVSIANDERGVRHPVAFAILGLLLIYTHLRPTRLLHRYGGVDSDYLDEALFVPMVLMLDSIEIAFATMVASLVSNIVSERPPVKVVFNVAQTVLATLAGYGVAHLGGAGNDAPISTRSLVAAALGCVVFAAASSVAVASIVRLAAGHPLLSGLREQWRARGVASLGALLLGLVAGVAVHAYPVVAFPAVVLGWTVERAYVAVVVQRQARLAAEALQDAVVAIGNCVDPDAVEAQVLTAVTTVLHAKAAVVVRADTVPGQGALLEPFEADTALLVTDRVGGGSWQPDEQQALTTLATVGAEALRSARLLAQLTAITQGQGEGVLAIDSTGMIQFANPAAQRLLGRREDVVGMLTDEVLTIDLPGGPLDLGALALTDDALRHEDALLRAGGQSIAVAVTVAPLAAPQTGIVVVLHDITQRKVLEGRLTYLAFHDPLTDLPNRRLFEDRLDHALARGERQQAVHALLMVDIDRFKLVNDSYGHPIGDELLSAIAGRLRGIARSSDTCARIGGDEFAVLLEDIDEVHQATSFAERILAGLAEGFEIDGKEIFVSASIGVATSDQALTRDALVAAADAAAYSAKAAGKGRWHLHRADTSGGPRARLELEMAMRHALEEDQFELHYQPLVDTRTGALVGAEALVRWNATEGLIGPHEFIPLAEETGLIVPLGAWVLEEACRQAQAWTIAHPERPPLKVSVNLSAQQLNRGEIVSDVAGVLRRTNLRPGQLCLEVTETVAMNDTDAAIGALADLRSLGVLVAIDDFGTGYSSLSYFRRFPHDIVKIDQTFTAGLGEDAVDSEIVAAVVRLAVARGVGVVAEGVETDYQRRILADLGCPFVQGYLIAKPLTADDFAVFWDGQYAPLVAV